MDKQIARDLLPLVHDRDNLNAIIAYAEYRISVLHKALEQSRDIDVVRMLQGSIAECRKLITLREQAVANKD